MAASQLAAVGIGDEGIEMIEQNLGRRCQLSLRIQLNPPTANNQSRLKDKSAPSPSGPFIVMVLSPPARTKEVACPRQYLQVLIAIALGILIGYFYPNLGKEMKPRLHRTDQDDDRAYHLLHRGARHLLDG
jgi:hypothetical protein